MLLGTHSESNPLYWRPLVFLLGVLTCHLIVHGCEHSVLTVLGLYECVCPAPTSLLLPLAPSPSSLVETGSSYTAQADLDLGFSGLNIPSARVTAVLHPPCPATGVFSIPNQIRFQERVFNLLFLNSFYPSWHLMSSI